MKTYKEILAKVKKKNPEMSHKDAQKAASSIFREAKEAEEKKKEKPGGGEEPKAVPSIDVALSEKIEASILGEHHTYDKNKIMQVANSFGDFKLIEAGKDGVNTLVYLDGPTRVPAAGYFKIFIAR
jgi:hypothetical protein